MSDSLNILAKILRVPKDFLGLFESRLTTITGKKGILDEIAEQNTARVKAKLAILGVSPNAPALEVYDALTSKIECDDMELLDLIGHKNMRGIQASVRVVDFVSCLKEHPQGFFLKKEKAAEFLRNEPPKKILAALGYSSVSELLAKEDIEEVYSALRFLEDMQWQNEIFFKQYESLTLADFEHRPLVLRALSEKWAIAAEKFVKKKYHNVSHLKELGVIFVIPVFLGMSGETLRLLSLLLHYIKEISFYSSVFEHTFATNPATFSSNMISALRGDCISQRLDSSDYPKNSQPFLVIQRYLAKDDENDWRLFEPRINPEALHWARAERELTRIDHFDFWHDLDWVGDYFKNAEGGETLVSFDLVDTVMSLVKQKEMIKYLYHQQEALWNQIFISYFSEAELEKKSQDFLVKGWFAV